MSGKTAYQGFGLYWMIDKINASNTTQIIVSFYGERIGGANPGIVLYGNNFSLTDPDGQPGTYEILVAWSGILWLDKLNGWNPVLSTLPTFNSGNYTVVFRNVNSTVCIYSITINSSTYLIKYNTGIPWDSIGYVGVRPDNGIVLPLSFQVIASIPANYTVYVNGKLYKSGYGSINSITLRVFRPTTINISFPEYHMRVSEREKFDEKFYK
ncbi:hypothetical protein SJAV_01480 [Sulfurisphaera javensis]|uniref:Uncharacterized protein n=1 Tax=Sulfurisphaera javensis TaxID=2049879 RepID=A0AAT9GMT9_9CREN